ncbi:MAG: flagellar brake protein [Pseudomonadales bacterium]|nr:flagellar brake protein [Pseudomonadales bacterium]
MNSEKNLEIATGCPVFVEISDTSEKLKSRIIGHDQQNYVIIACPRAGTCNNDTWQPGAKVVIKYVHDGVVIAFQTPVLNSIQAPANLLFLAYPREVTRQNLRGWKRYQCDFKGWLPVAGNELVGSVLDISMGGCCISIPNDSLGSAEIPEADTKLDLTIQHPESNELAKLPATLSNSWASGNSRKFGVAYQSLTSDQERQVKDLIFVALHI